MHAIAGNLITDEPAPRLIGGRHRESGRIVFPCPAGAEWAAHPLGREGTVWSFTVQRYRPKSPPYAGPEAFRPWVVAYVELPGEVIVEARLDDVAFDAVHIGQPVTFAPGPLDPADGESPLIPAFRPRAIAA